MVLLLAALSAAGLGTLYRGVSTLRRLEVVEAERDRWQRPDEVVRALDLGEKAAVADLGCGAGYFALKLSRSVGPQGKVLAVDIRRLPLLFLKVRALLLNRHNVTVVRGEADDPHLPAEGLEAVLVANTYHELADAGPILDHVFRALRPGGRLVVVDPSPEDASERAAHHHETAAAAETRLRRAGFEIARRDDRFVERSAGGAWWLVVARKP